MGTQIALFINSRNHVHLQHDRLPPGVLYAAVVTDQPPESEDEIRDTVDRLVRLIVEQKGQRAQGKDAA